MRPQTFVDYRCIRKLHLRNVWNVCLLAAEASAAGIVEPAKLEIIHEPNLGLTSRSDVDLNGVKIDEAVAEGDGCKRAVGERRASEEPTS